MKIIADFSVDTVLLLFTWCSWLYREASVSDCQMSEDGSEMTMSVIISPGKLGQFASKFPKIKVDPAFIKSRERFGVC